MKKSAALKPSKNQSLSPLKQKLDAVLGKPQLLLGDDENQFAQLEALIAAELNPQDILETLWCRDVIERLFEILRLRRWKAQFIELRELGAVKVLLNQSSQLIRYPEKIDDLVNGWGAGNQEAITRIYSILKNTDREHSHIEAQAVGANLETLAAIESLLLANEVRRDAIIKEIDRHRDLKAKRGALDVDFKDVTTTETVNDQSKKG